MGDLKNIYYLLQQQLLSYYSTDRKIERELSERANSLNLSSYERRNFYYKLRLGLQYLVYIVEDI